MNKLYVREKFFSLGGDFTITDEQGQDKYFVKGSFFSIPKVFTITDKLNQEVGTITKKTWSFLPKFYVHVDDNPVITIEQQLTFFKAKYTIDAGNLTVNGDWLHKQFTVERYGKIVARIDEKWFNFADHFEVSIYDETLEKLIVSLVIAIDFVNHEDHSS